MWVSCLGLKLMENGYGKWAHSEGESALQNADKYKEEARLVKDGVTELLNTKENVNPQEKRPALARKRAKFSMKPNASDSSTILEPTLQMDQLRDPDEFFAAYERLENAKKEIRRQRGEDPNEAKVSTTTVRQRHPELPRRKTSYKHHVYSSQPESDTSFAQETLQEDIGSQPTFYSQQESVIAGESQEEEVAGSVTETEDRVDELFNHLMSTCNNDNLDDKGRLSYLEEFLNAKPPEITELNLPDFHSIPKVNFVSPVKTLPNQSRLSDTRLSLDNSRGKTPAIQIQLSDNRFSPLGSPTPPRSPFFAISTFGKQSKLSEGKDPFSLHDIDSSHTGISKTHSGQSTHTRKYKESSVGLGSLVDNEVTETAINDVIHAASAEDSGNLSEQCHNLEEKEKDGIIGVDYAANAINENGGIQGNAEEVEKAASGTKINLIVEDITDNGHPCSVQEMEEIVKDVSEKAVPSTSPEADVEISAIEDLNTHCFQSVQTEDNIIEDLNESRPAQNTDIVSEQQNEEQPKKPANKRKTTKRAPKVDVRKTRQSLAAQTDADIIEDLDESRPAQNLDVVSEQPNEEQPKTSVNKRKKTIRAPKVDLRKRSEILAGQTDANAIEDPDESRPAQIPDIVPVVKEQPKTSVNKRKKTIRAPKVDLRKTRQILAAQTDATVIEDPDESITAQIPDIVPEQQNEEQPKTSLNRRKTTTRASKADASKADLKKRRAGTSWTGGVRKSNRIKRRPLEYWKGERLLYGRVHNSLPTIIGVKYLSPAKENGKPECFKVESFFLVESIGSSIRADLLNAFAVQSSAAADGLVIRLY
ncbi:centromere protein C/Mif2/cnp3 [Tanacetum coccineum]|uniref:Centromere protein C/Mif2/cnp3 n=1 Tax=Tanacetum coccineum TaxID=301880 RepID=A0ABQ5GFS3_9ASTR